MKRSVVVIGLAAFTAAVLAAAARTALPDRVIGFDDLPPGEVTTQLQDRGGPAQGVVFGTPTNYGFTFANTQTGGPGVGQGQVSRFVCGAPRVAASDKARSGSQIARIGCGTEFGAYGTFGVLPRWRTKLTVYVQAFTPGFRPGPFVLTAYDYRRKPIATQTIETAAGPTGWLPLTVTTGSPRIAYFAVYLNRIDAGGLVVGIDDLTYDQPSVPPDPQISFSRVDGSRDVIVHQGETASVDFRVTRWNGSVGNVALTTSVLNPEIDAASFSPNPAAGTVSKLLLHAAINPNFNGDVPPLPTSTATASPLTANAGTTPDSNTFPLAVAPVFAFYAPGEFDLPTCLRTTMFAGLSVAPGFAQSIALTASVTLKDGSPSGIEATFDPATYTSGFSKSPEVRLYAPTDEPRKDAILTLAASSPGYPTRRAAILLKRIGPTVEDVYTDVPGSSAVVTKVQAEEFLKPPQRVRIRGTGFCSGTRVEFGNQKARATPDSISDDGRLIRVAVPRLATDGRITLLLPSGDRVRAPRLIDVETYRGRDGFEFVNAAGRSLGWDEFVQVFGFDQTHFSVDACPFVPFVKCEVTTPVPSPLALAIYLYVSPPPKGLCFGMSVASLRLRHGAPPPSTFGATTTNDLDYPSGPTPALSSYIHQMHVLQHSVEMTFSRRTGFESQSRLHDVLVDQLRRQEPVIVGFTPPGSDTGHAIVAYDIRERGPDFDILAYNPNSPYRAVAEAGYVDASGNAHAAADVNSTLYVANGGWSFPELGWRGSIRTLYVIPYSALPFEPRLPQSIAESLVVFGASGAGAVDQVTSESGQELFRNGGVNLRAFPGARVLAPLDSREGSNPRVLLPAGQRYTVSIRRIGVGAYTAGFYGADMTALVAGQASGSGQAGSITLDGRAGSLGFSGRGGGPVAVTLVAKAGDRSLHTATLRTTSAAGATNVLAFDRARGAVSVRHTGPPAAVTVELGWTGRTALPAAFTSPMIRVGAGDTLSFSPTAWQSLGSQAIRMTQTRANGSRTTRTLRTVARATVSVPALRLKHRLSGRRATLSLTGRVTGAGRRNALATVTFLVLRGSRVVARSTTSVAAARLARPVVWKTKRLQPGRYTVVGVLTVLSGRNGAVALSGVSRSKRIALTIR